MSEDHPEWLFDEARHTGVDYANREVVADYDRQHQGFRDFEKEAEMIVAALDLSENSTVLDVGCGTGGLSVCLARKCKQVYAVDVSQAMIEVLEGKIEAQGLGNITPQRAGFLTYRHRAEAPDAVVVNIALHHLPDFWKQIALCRLHDLLKPGGKMFLADVVFGFDPRTYEEAVEGWLHCMRDLAGPRMADETIVHIRDEFSTWDWVMSGMLERAGFRLEQCLDLMPQMRAYICSKPGEQEPR
ncbi:MAG TPA: class I SAM-dependent methyltransferase [Syntrophobacteraceae bacterium]|nr:class I SAM-dependent methyltransferase [Syntrophobacteraceae bacterium]